jgi:virginiamycin B lyase
MALVGDRAGNIWFRANFKGYIGKLDPRTGLITEYPLPDKDADDPHNPVFDQEGTLWFTVRVAMTWAGLILEPA